MLCQRSYEWSKVDPDTDINDIDFDQFEKEFSRNKEAQEKVPCPIPSVVILSSASKLNLCVSVGGTSIQYLIRQRYDNLGSQDLKILMNWSILSQCGNLVVGIFALHLFCTQAGRYKTSAGSILSQFGNPVVSNFVLHPFCSQAER